MVYNWCPLHTSILLSTLPDATCSVLPAVASLPLPAPAHHHPAAAGIEELPEDVVPLVSDPTTDNDTLLAPAVANTTVGTPPPATQRSSAAGATSSLAITMFAVVLGAVFAL